MIYYRIVSDYGFGDKSWSERMTPEDEILAKLKELHDRDCETIEQAEDFEYIHYIEEDCESDEEDWDWMDS